MQNDSSKRKRAKGIYDSIKRNYVFAFISKRRIRERKRKRFLKTPYDIITKCYYLNFIPKRELKRGRPPRIPKPHTETGIRIIKKCSFDIFDKEITRKTPCKEILKKHKILLSEDPERLTTDFMVDLTGCNCVRRNNAYAEK